jgi:hypothetical protein
MTANQILSDGIGPYRIISANFNQIDAFINIYKCNKIVVRLPKFVSKCSVLSSFTSI